MHRRDSNKTVNIGGKLLSIAAACLLCSIGFNAWAIEPSGERTKQPTRTEESDTNHKINIAEIERAIAKLTTPVDAEKMSWIQQAIVKQRPEVRKRLNRALDAKMTGFYKLPIKSSSTQSADQPKEDLPVQNDPAPEDIRMQIDDLNLSQNATVEDLLTRDKLIGEIAAIQDPVIRYDLIEYL